MSNFLIELLVEEIPAGFQTAAAENFSKIFVGEFEKNRIKFSDAKTFISPRRMVFSANLEDKIAAFNEEKKGPQTSAPSEVIDKFLNSVGISRDNCSEKNIKGKNFVVVEIKHPEKRTKELLGEIAKNVICSIPWPKSMHWGVHSFYFVRPIRNIMCMFAGKPVDVDMSDQIGLRSVNYTFGHRVTSNRKIFANDINEYVTKMRDACVFVDQNERREIILNKCSDPNAILADAVPESSVQSKDFTVNITQNLLEEVVGLVEYPVVMLGKISDKFMCLPDEIITTTMRTHQRYFPTSFGNKLAPYFVFVANNLASDNNATIRAGNERVLSARLSDALFFFENDRTIPLEQHLNDLKKIAFNDKLGTIYDRIFRIRDICSDLCDELTKCTRKSNERLMLPANSKEILQRAALLAKCDLATSVVCEFTELQGIMGAHYAHYQGESDEVCDVIRDQYKMVDDLYSPLSSIYSMADKIDTITSLFAIGKVPTGSKDPFALRRAAIGIVKIITKYEMAIDLQPIIERAFQRLLEGSANSEIMDPKTVEKVMAFILDRFRVVLKDSGIDHAVISSVTSIPQDIHSMQKKALILDAAFKSDLGNQIITIYKRAQNIVQGNFGQLVDESLFQEDAEKALFDEIKSFETSMLELEGSDLDLVEKFEKKLNRTLAMESAMAEFFTKVLVNAENEEICKNRVGILAKLVGVFNEFLPEISVGLDN